MFDVVYRNRKKKYIKAQKPVERVRTGKIWRKHAKQAKSNLLSDEPLQTNSSKRTQIPMIFSLRCHVIKRTNNNKWTLPRPCDDNCARCACCWFVPFGHEATHLITTLAHRKMALSAKNTNNRSERCVRKQTSHPSDFGPKSLETEADF